jgi:hypothetical protein
MILEMILSVSLIVAVAGLAMVYKKLSDAQADAELQAVVLAAIVAAFKGSQWGVETIGDYLDGADRAKLAETTYYLMPITFQRKMTQEQFGAIVQAVYGEAVQLYRRNAILFNQHVEGITNIK